MDYEKKYKEALERAKEYIDVDIDNTLPVYAKGTMEYLFPELAEEPEDERIRKALIDFFNSCQSGLIQGVPVSHILIWLEKQGGSKETHDENDEPKFRVDDWITNGEYTWYIKKVGDCFYDLKSPDGRVVDDTISYVDEHFHLWTIADAKPGDVLIDEGNNIGIYKEIEGICWHSYIYLGFDNRLYGSNIGGSHVQNNTKPATKEQYDLLFSKMKEAGYEWNAGKLIKHDDDFNVGDWIVQNDDHSDILFVNEKQNDLYGVFDKDGDYSYASYETLNNHYHLWTIKDAKPGDILMIGEVPVMFKGNFDNCIDTYCHLEDDVEQWSFNSSFKMFKKDCTINPADPENRKFLLRKMKEAGYEWDAEKKELVKKVIDEDKIKSTIYHLINDQRMTENVTHGKDSYDGIKFEDMLNWIESK